MKTVIFRMSIAGHAMPQYGLGEFAFQPGDVIEIDETLAGHWQASGIVEAVPDVADAAADVADDEAPQRKRKGKGR